VKPKPTNETGLEEANRKEIYARLFEDLVIQHARTALALLGKIPSEGGLEPGEPDPASAKVLIDQLEMLREKTRGNLGAEERDLLERSLLRLQKDFLEQLEKPQ
jgi:hypothetical protein